MTSMGDGLRGFRTGRYCESARRCSASAVLGGRLASIASSPERKAAATRWPVSSSCIAEWQARHRASVTLATNAADPDDPRAAQAAPSAPLSQSDGIAQGGHGPVEAIAPAGVNLRPGDAPHVVATEATEHSFVEPIVAHSLLFPADTLHRPRNHNGLRVSSADQG